MAEEQNPFLLAADNSPALLPLLRQKPQIASLQDQFGYSLVHAAASYNRLDLLRALVHEFNVDVNLKDQDNDTALFVVETVEAAKLLVEHLGADARHKGSDGLTAAEWIEAEGEFPAVAAYLKTFMSADNGVKPSVAAAAVPPKGIDVTMTTMDQTEDTTGEANPEFRRRIEEFAQRDDIDTAEGQADLRRLVEDALADQGLGDERSVRRKLS
ncbi:hypothetical protein L249_5953 [Ophiocordyceps polyrhachis-furcata BCC 54312]|uniref:Uncharacterized protein n=1 Tax=Ophiocordyceps polyrhachis-furcata BCC 54312 TaxID=1330021 RepID=A0A367LJ74_9HYPO|nr:hypothetical protein L249_5953 [Ophiocordyceps polyrhachis-furcata BCC 54312]